MNYKTSKGSVSIEAAISLSAFMFAIVTILCVINICLVQAKMAVAINTTAKEISQYSYLYGLTGFNESTAKLAEGASETKASLNDAISNINTIYNEIQNLGKTGKSTDITDPNAVLNSWDQVSASLKNGTAAAGQIEGQIKAIAKDPKQFIFGIAKLLASEGLEEAKSKLVAAPVSKLLVQKHLKRFDNDNAEDFLRSLQVVPVNGSYVDGLDFTDSTLFPYGSNEIRIVVRYKVKVIPLLPIKHDFTFTQTAVTHGWLGGSLTYKDTEKKAKEDKGNTANADTIWTKATISERVELIRHMGIEDMKAKGYSKTKGLTDVQAYNSSKNDFVMISSMNPLYSNSEKAVTVADIDEEALQRSIVNLSGKIRSTTSGLKSVNVSDVKGNQTVDCSGATNTVVLVIPEDKGLKEKIEAVIKKTDTKGVKFDIVASYGTGTRVAADNKKGK